MYDDHSPSSSFNSCRLRPLRATKATDMAQLLDPSYSPVRASYDNQIYVDHTGEVHDPDFRLFAPANYTSKSSPRQRAFNDDDDDVIDEGVAFCPPHRASFDDYRPSSRASDPTFTFSYSYEEPIVYDTGYFSDDEPRLSNKLRRRRASALSEERQDSPVEQPRSPSPSCSHSLRRQWHAFRLRTQTVAFRARRRMSRLVSG